MTDFKIKSIFSKIRLKCKNLLDHLFNQAILKSNWIVPKIKISAKTQVCTLFYAKEKSHSLRKGRKSQKRRVLWACWAVREVKTAELSTITGSSTTKSSKRLILSRIKSKILENRSLLSSQTMLFKILIILNPTETVLKRQVAKENLKKNRIVHFSLLRKIFWWWASARIKRSL